MRNFDDRRAQTGPKHTNDPVELSSETLPSSLPTQREQTLLSIFERGKSLSSKQQIVLETSDQRILSVKQPRADTENPCWVIREDLPSSNKVFSLNAHDYETMLGRRRGDSAPLRNDWHRLDRILLEVANGLDTFLSAKLNDRIEALIDLSADPMSDSEKTTIFSISRGWRDRFGAWKNRHVRDSVTNAIEQTELLTIESSPEHNWKITAHAGDFELRLTVHRETGQVIELTLLDCDEVKAGLPFLAMFREERLREYDRYLESLLTDLKTKGTAYQAVS